METLRPSDILSSPNSQGLSDFETYSKTELPRLIEANLQVMVDAEVAPLEENIKLLLVDVVRRCQSTVAQNYGRIKSSADITASQLEEKSVPAVEPQHLQHTNARDGGSIHLSSEEPPFRGPPVLFPESAASVDRVEIDSFEGQKPYPEFLSDSDYEILLNGSECQCDEGHQPNGFLDEVCAVCGLQRPFDTFQ